MTTGTTSDRPTGLPHRPAGQHGPNSWLASPRSPLEEILWLDETLVSASGRVRPRTLGETVTGTTHRAGGVVFLA